MEMGIDAAFIKADLTSEADMIKVVEDTVERWGSVDVLVNNVGTHLYKGLLELSIEEFDRVIAVD